jgi:hypothetical protein
MSLPLEHRQSVDPSEEDLVDRLVDGELGEVERRELLLRFENEADGWRRCALAFLEAQNWRQAFAPLVAPPPPRPSFVTGHTGSKPAAWRSAGRLTALAAGLILAFALGAAFQGMPEKTAPALPFADGSVPVPAGYPESSSSVQAPVVELSKPTEPPAPFDSVVKRWEQRGYRAETQKRLVSLELKDGRKLNVPIQEVRLHYIGANTY